MGLWHTFTGGTNFQTDDMSTNDCQMEDATFNLSTHFMSRIGNSSLRKMHFPLPTSSTNLNQQCHRTCKSKRKDFVADAVELSLTFTPV